MTGEGGNDILIIIMMTLVLVPTLRCLKDDSALEEAGANICSAQRIQTVPEENTYKIKAKALELSDRESVRLVKQRKEVLEQHFLSTYFVSVPLNQTILLIYLCFKSNIQQRILTKLVFSQIGRKTDGWKKVMSIQIASLPVGKTH